MEVKYFLDLQKPFYAIGVIFILLEQIYWLVIET